jgi:hypothetical protein
MTEPQRWGHPDPDGTMHIYPLGPYVLYADAKAWVEREVAAARAEWDVVAADAAYNATEIGRKQGQRDALDAAVAAVEREPWRERRSNNDGMGGVVGGVAVSTPETFTHLVSRDSLLAAITALRPTAGGPDAAVMDAGEAAWS